MSLSQADRKAKQARWAARARLTGLTDSQSSPLVATSTTSTPRFRHDNANIVARQPEDGLQTTHDDANMSDEPPEQEIIQDIFQYQPSQQSKDVGISEEASDNDLVPLNKSQFYCDYHDWRQQSQLNEVNIWITIEGREIELWDLWEAVTIQKVEPEERDWQLIAETLDFDWNELLDVPDELRNCYEAFLADFEEFLVQFDGEDDMTDHVDSVEEERHPFNSSPPRLTSTKRAFDHTASDNVYPESARKRLKFSRDSEIPSTPEHGAGYELPRTSISAAVSPADRRHKVLPRSSQSDRKARQVATVQGLEVRNGSVESSAPTTPRRSSNNSAGEDVVYATQSEIPLEESQSNITPSQQLHLESDARSSPDGPAATATTPRRSAAKAPFPTNGSDDEFEVLPTPKPRFGKGANPLLSNPVISRSVKRRSLPASYYHSSTPKGAASSRRSTPSSSAPSRAQPVAAPPKPQTRAEKLNALVEYFESMGYTERIARRCLEATCWKLGLAGEMMQMLKRGDPLPTNYEGVWTQRDDDGLVLIDSPEEPRDEREARRRAKESRRLEYKHGEEGLRLRRKWFATRETL
jgi:hypothetical protein